MKLNGHFTFQYFPQPPILIIGKKSKNLFLDIEIKLSHSHIFLLLKIYLNFNMSQPELAVFLPCKHVQSLVKKWQNNVPTHSSSWCSSKVVTNDSRELNWRKKFKGCLHLLWGLLYCAKMATKGPWVICNIVPNVLVLNKVKFKLPVPKRKDSATLWG